MVCKATAIRRRRSATGVVGRSSIRQPSTCSTLQASRRCKRSAGPASSGWGAGGSRRNTPWSCSRHPWRSCPQGLNCSSLRPPANNARARQRWPEGSSCGSSSRRAVTTTGCSLALSGIHRKGSLTPGRGWLRKPQPQSSNISSTIIICKKNTLQH